MRSLASRLVSSMAAASIGLVLFGTSAAWGASSPNVVGQKYSDAESAISDAGLKPVISTTVGDQKAWPDCLVTNTVARTVPPPENSNGTATNQLLVSLNCDDGVASAKTPGFSAASAEGKAAKTAIEAAAAAQKSSG